jgi:DNA helicase HerA-like ATPase
MTDTNILLGGNGKRQILLNAAMANRHGLITGATGTGQTVTLQVLAESFSRLGVPVFTADVKGDLSGLAGSGRSSTKITQRLEYVGVTQHPFEACPTLFWDVYGDKGHPVRTTISDMGPTLLSNLLQLNETQEGVLQICFSVADDEGLLLLDLKDLRAMLNWVADNATGLGREYGRISKQSVSAILRRLLVLQEAGGDIFFGEPAIRTEHLMQIDFSGRGVVSILDATTLYQSPRIYATFLLWLLSELMEELPERGDADRPRLVFFFDEAHLLFSTAPKALLEKITQVVRLIRSKGVSVFFITQYPNDVPDEVIGQLGNRVQHALRAFTPKDWAWVRPLFRPWTTRAYRPSWSAQRWRRLVPSSVRWLSRHDRLLSIVRPSRVCTSRRWIESQPMSC